MIRSLLVRGMLVGLAAGVLAFAFAYAVGEPQLQAAIDFEHQATARSAEAGSADPVSRDVQSTAGLLTGTLTLGVAFGGLFALGFAWAYGRVGLRGARPTAAALALAAFLTITLVPFTKYPANPPSVGDPGSIDQRTLLSLSMIVITAAALLTAVRLRRQLSPRLSAWNASLVAGGAFLALIVVAELILPAINETPPGFPADVLYRFRLASLGTSAMLWLTIGLGFGAAAERLLSPARAGAPGGSGPLRAR